MDRKTIIIISAIALLLIAIAVVVTVSLGGSEKREAETDIRGNTIRLAAEYLEQGEYQRALDLLDRLLIENADDEEARALRDSAVEAKRSADREQVEEQRAQQENLKDSIAESIKEAQPTVIVTAPPVDE